MLKTLLAVAVFASWSPPLAEFEPRSVAYECSDKGCTLSKADFVWLVNQHKELLKQIRICLKTREA